MVYPPGYLLFFTFIPVVFSQQFAPNVTNATLANICYTNQTEFGIICKEEFQGVADGPRCYFLLSYQNITAPDAEDWTSAWDACKVYDSKLAQVHTQSEYAKITNYMKELTAQYPAFQQQKLILAIKDDSSTVASACVMDSGTILWHDDAATGDETMLMANTWLGRYHSCDDSQVQASPPRCFFLSQVNSATVVVDLSCNATADQYVALCEYEVASQNYTNVNACLAEVPVKTITVTTPDDCAEACSAKRWCRSFNVLGCDNDCDDKICQLYSWSFDDTDRNTTSVPCCYGYNYTP